MYAFLNCILFCLMNTYSYVTMTLFHFVKPVSFPFSFDVSGATLVVIGTHAAFRELEQSDVDELLMEPV